MEYSSLSDKLLKLNKDFFKLEDYEYQIKYELFRLYNKKDSEGVRMLLNSLCFVYEKFYAGYNGFSDAFEEAISDLDLNSEDAGRDFLNLLKNPNEIQEFYRKSVNYSLNPELN